MGGAVPPERRWHSGIIDEHLAQLVAGQRSDITDVLKRRDDAPVERTERFGAHEALGLGQDHELPRGRRPGREPELAKMIPRVEEDGEGHGEGAPMKVTLDTNVLQELWNDRPKRAVVERLLALAEEKGIDLAVTARVREDIPDEPLASKIRTLSDIGVEESGSDTRLGHWD
ncbi:MAG TPA: hypothetical protein VF195_12205 [Actinomycetota bacterium]